jgi:hypothetical protein
VDERQLPVSGAEVMLLRHDRSAVSVAVTTEDGRFTLEGLPAGEFVVNIRKGRAKCKATVAAGENQLLDVTLPGVEGVDK